MTTRIDHANNLDKWAGIFRDVSCALQLLEAAAYIRQLEGLVRDGAHIIDASEVVADSTDGFYEQVQAWNERARALGLVEE